VTKDVYLALGGNIGDPASTLARCLGILRGIDGVELSAVSRTYQNGPVGGPDNQPDFLNCVCRIKTSLSPEKLLDKCLATEIELGRVRKERWGPRNIDIDILLYGNTSISQPGLSIPHPRLRERLFMLVPLMDVAPESLKLPPDGRLLIDVLEEQLLAHQETLALWAGRVV
jgi:2-amino-4-hydroxy-6-hydroxymethyldihydropteridine diphosphokinase